MSTQRCNGHTALLSFHLNLLCVEFPFNTRTEKVKLIQQRRLLLFYKERKDTQSKKSGWNDILLASFEEMHINRDQRRPRNQETVVDFSLPTTLIVPQFAGRWVPFHRSNNVSCRRDQNMSSKSQSSSLGVPRGLWCISEWAGPVPPCCLRHTKSQSPRWDLGPPGFLSTQKQSTHRETHTSRATWNGNALYLHLLFFLNNKMYYTRVGNF